MPSWCFERHRLLSTVAMAGCLGLGSAEVAMAQTASTAGPSTSASSNATARTSGTPSGNSVLRTAPGTNTPTTGPKP